MSGTLYGIGVGPGDPELLTLKGHRILTNVPVIAYPAPDSGTSFARAIVAQHLRTDQLEIPIVIPMKIERFPAKDVYNQCTKDISFQLNLGKDVAVLCEGDPFFYGSFMYLYERLAGDHTCEVVPGVSSMMASSAVVGRPLAARNDVLTVVPAPLGDAAIIDRLETSDAICLIKIGRHLERVRAIIKDAGLLDQAIYLERITLEHQKIYRLGELVANTAPYFSMILIYKGAEVWISDLPLAGTSA